MLISFVCWISKKEFGKIVLAGEERGIMGCPPTKIPCTAQPGSFMINAPGEKPVILLQQGQSDNKLLLSSSPLQVLETRVARFFFNSSAVPMTHYVHQSVRPTLRHSIIADS